MSQVFFTKSPSAAAELFDRAGLGAVIAPGDSVALKIHFGEPGNKAFIKPERVKTVVTRIKELGGHPFFTDANTLYRGRRNDNESHLETAREHGYTLERTGAEVMIADETGNYRGRELSVNFKHFKKLYVAPKVFRAKALIVLTHFKGHEATGFGGALKNVGMGLGSKLGKLKMHQDCPNCPELKTCRKNQTIEACWFGSPESVQERMVEYSAGILENFKGKTAYLNFVTDVSENCDCYPHNSAPIVPDVGILASFDPVAIDQASVDFVTRELRAVYPNLDWTRQLSYAESLGLGSREYELVVE